MKKHILYKTGDKDAPDVIKDNNGEVCLNLCRICGLGEADLDLKKECNGIKKESKKTS